MTSIVRKIQGDSSVNMLRGLNFSFRSLVAREPSFWLLYQPYIIWNQKKKKANGVEPRESVVGSHTELVIDGFQGSANSFATIAFKQSQTKFVNLAHHLHSPVQIIQAIEKNIPVLLTIREPEGAVLSLTSRWSYVCVNSAIKSYIGFYSKLKAYTDGLIVSTFPQTTQQLDKVVVILNNRFGTNFDLVDVAKANVEAREKVNDDPKVYVLKQNLKQHKKQELALEKNCRLLRDAQALHQEYAAIAKQQMKLGKINFDWS